MKIEFSKLFCSRFFYIELYRISSEYRTGLKIFLDKWKIHVSVSVLGLTLMIEIGEDYAG